jgi:IS605 OrfB family transposase
MLTTKLNIITCSNSLFITDKQQQYSYAFRFLFKTFDESCNQSLENYIKKRFNINNIEFDSLKSEVETFIKRNNTQNKKKEKDILSKTKELDELNSKKSLTKKEKYFRFKLIKKISFLTKSITQKPVFGGRKNLQYLSHLKNQIHLLEYKLSLETNIINQNQINNELINLNQRLSSQKDTFKNKRLMSFYNIGEANQKGNRFFDFSKLTESILIYKPNFKTKIEFKLKISKNRINLINKLVSLSNDKEISLSVYLSNKSISISYNDEIISGYILDVKSRIKEVNKVKEITDDKDLQTILIKEIYIKYFNKLKEDKLVGKIEHRVCAIDMNPSYLGVSIIERDFENENIDTGEHCVKVIHKFSYDLTKFTKKLPKNISNDERLFHRNKHKHEIKEMIIQLFNIVKHYKCSSFIMEDLDFKPAKEKNKKGKEANRQTKNIWYRGLLEGSIKKKTVEQGVELVLVNPSYSSFIGNMMYNNFDPINSAIEIGRRGLYKYVKNLTTYPLITDNILNNMESILVENGIDVSAINVCELKWVGLYNLVKTYRWRGGLVDKTKFSMSTRKSGIKIRK